MEAPSWDDLFMTMAYLVASKSKDRRAHIGAVIVGPDKEVRSTGYNGFVRGLNDDVPERHEKPEKFFWTEHGEKNAIYNANLIGVSLKDCIMYTNGMPCMGCARGIIQSGIREVIVDGEWNKDNSKKWKEQSRRSLEMFEEVGVGIRSYDGPFIELRKFHHGKYSPLKLITSS